MLYHTNAKSDIRHQPQTVINFLGKMFFKGKRKTNKQTKKVCDSCNVSNMSFSVKFSLLTNPLIIFTINPGFCYIGEWKIPIIILSVMLDASWLTQTIQWLKYCRLTFCWQTNQFSLSINKIRGNLAHCSQNHINHQFMTEYSLMTNIKLSSIAQTVLGWVLQNKKHIFTPKMSQKAKGPFLWRPDIRIKVESFHTP